jgi:hypothetical protein
MSSSRLIRLGGLAALVGFAVSGALDAIWEFVFPDNVALSVQVASDTWFVVHLLYVIALLIGLVGLFGIYARQAERAGVLGLIALLMAYIGGTLLFAGEWSQTIVFPVFAHAAPQFMDHPDQNVLQALDASQIITTVLAFGGLILFAVASLRAAVLPRGAAVLVLAGAIMGMVGNLIGNMFLVGSLGGLLGTLGIVWVGYAVWSRPVAAAESTMSMTASGPSVANR